MFFVRKCMINIGKYIVFILLCFSINVALAELKEISEIRIFGNRAVQIEAIKGLMNLKPGASLEPGSVRNDIKAIFKSGYFQDIRIEKLIENDKLVLIVYVEEKPSIGKIDFDGFIAIEKSTISDKITVKKYTIIDEKKIATDVRMIEQQYVEKGYYLAKAGYRIEQMDSGEVSLIYFVIENNPISVKHINLLGNAYFSDADLKNGMATREKRWTTWISGMGVFKDEFINRDKEFIAYVYRDNGYAEATVSTPQARLDTNREHVDVSYYIEEGERFTVDSIKFTGDVVFPLKEIKHKMTLKEMQYFRISLFQNDLRILSDMYGDEGYAFVDIVPKTTLNREKKLMEIEYAITKNEKAYFRNIVVEGNTKTRDNVIRRNVKVAEGERFHSTKLEKSRLALERTNYFKDVIVQREPDQKNAVVDLKVKVNEKTTGNINAQIGIQPGLDGKSMAYSGSGSYSEANLLGKGWISNISLEIKQNPSVNEPSYGINTSLTEPSLFDGPWSITGFVGLNYDVSKATEEDIKLYTRRSKFGLSIGREIIEDLRVSLGYSYEKVMTNNISPIYEMFTEHGVTEKISQTLSYDKTNNYMMPTDGYSLSLSNFFAVKLFTGNNYFGKTEASASYFVPVVFFDDFKTNFRFAFEPGYVYPINNKPIPVWERFRLGSLLDMKGYLNREISPKIYMIDSPFEPEVISRNIGGNTRIYGVTEYFFPLLPEANLRFVTFLEAGDVLAEKQSFDHNNLKYNVGMGLRWLTPIAHFRFEWAWPIEKRKLGDSEFIFFIGNDNVSRF